MNQILLLKLTLAPSLVAMASLAARRWGLRVGGAIAGFPVVFGPIIFFIALEQGNDFAAEAALRGLASVLPFGGFALAMGWACLRWPLWVAVPLGWAVFLGGNALLMRFDPGLPASAFLALAGLFAGRAWLPHSRVSDIARPPSLLDLPMRMLSTLALLLSVTSAASTLGPAWSGAMAAFPVASSVLGIFAFLSNGPHGPARLYKGILLGSAAFACFCAALHLGLPKLGLAAGFGLALACAFCVQIGALFLASRRN